ncbi:MAG: hypothetical protein JWM88_3519 [Verrucomicrobia bacterium]|nr:hypothetical protein [Verrucomicrobiota bacterium]
MLSDLRFAFRQLTKSPGFTIVVLLILALGIGSATAMFTVVNSVLLRPVDYPDSERLFVIRETKLPEFPQFSVSPANYLDFAKQTDAFSGAYATSGTTFNLTGGAEPVRVAGQRATGAYFEVLRTPPMIGRGFGPAEDVVGKNNVVVLLHAFWQRQFGGRPEIVGQSIMLDGTPYTVLGVMPPNFRRGTAVDVVVPMAFSSEEAANRGGHYLNMVVRLKLAATAEQAFVQLSTLADRLAKQFPDTNKGWGVQLVSILDNNTGNVRPTLYSLLAAVGFLLLIGCANVANLLLARATVRQREMSIRSALGASRWQTMRLLLVESLVLALCGGAAGVLVARWGLDLLLAVAPEALPRAAEIALDQRAVLVTVGVSVLTGIGFGLVPALQSARPQLTAALGDGSRGASEGGRRRWLRSTLVVAEIALALILLTGAGLLMRSFAKMRQTSPGFEPSGVVTAAINLPQEKYRTPEKQVAFIEAVFERHRRLPGVESVAATHVLPFGGSDWVLGLEIESRPVAQSDLPNINYFSVSPDYFRTLGIPLQRGRAFTPQDRIGAPAVAIVSQSFAQRYFPQGDALGKRISVTNGAQEWREIVGIAGDVKHVSLDSPTQPQVYDAVLQHPFQNLSFALRAASTPAAAALAAPLRREVYAVDPTQPVYAVSTLDALVADSMSRSRFAMTLFGIFSGIAVTLAALGIYSVMAYGVSQRYREFGIRLALGAKPADVLQLVLRNGTRLVLLGIAAGLVGAVAGARLIRSMLFQTDSADPVIFGVVAFVMAVVALAACWIPARRATRIDPMVALRDA